MIKPKSNNTRRDFLKSCGLASLPFFMPGTGGSPVCLPNNFSNSDQALVNFISDGLFFSPKEYLQRLAAINQSHPIEPDFYGNGGATKKLEEKFAKQTGKEKAIFLPTGTMANQLAIKLLNGANTKVMVPENSHVFRDEADAAQAVHGQRLIPVGKGKAYFDQKELEEAIAYYDHGEVFKSGLGTVLVEHPIRRADGVAIPLEVIQGLSSFCKAKGYKLHLDGARLHIAAAYTGVPISEYASYFDTVYISLYKYLNAAGGAMLCGDAQLIDQVAHQIKIYGGTTFQTWGATAMALYYLEGIEERWKKVVQSARQLIAALNQLDGVHLSTIDQGSNIYHLTLDKSIELKIVANYFYHEQNIWLGRAAEKGIIKFIVNESLLSRETDQIVAAWKEGIEKARK